MPSLNAITQMGGCPPRPLPVERALFAGLSEASQLPIPLDATDATPERRLLAAPLPTGGGTTGGSSGGTGGGTFGGTFGGTGGGKGGGTGGS